jgi:hypothetical protein
VWFGEVFDDDEPNAKLKVGASLAEVIEADGGVERWRFSSPADAKRAADWVLAHAGKRAAIKGDASAAFATWGKKLKIERPRIARLEPGRGPISLAVDRSFGRWWLHPRAPATSYLSGRVLAPVMALVGPIDPRFGKHVGIYISACPTGDDQVFEIAVQTDKPSPVDAYFGTNRFMHAIHLRMQVCYDGAASWAVTEHDVEQGTAGYYRTTHVKNRAEAEKLFAERIKNLDGTPKLARPPKWYGSVLEEIDHHHRRKTSKPQNLTLRAAYPPYTQSIGGDYLNPEQMLESYKVASYIGGTPRFCQESWEFIPKNPYSKRDLLHIVTLGSGHLGWTDFLNDGDLGSLAFFAAPGDPFGTLTFSCH